MKFLDLTIPLGIATPPWPTYEPLQVKYFKRLAPNGANGQIVVNVGGGSTKPSTRTSVTVDPIVNSEVSTTRG